MRTEKEEQNSSGSTNDMRFGGGGEFAGQLVSECATIGTSHTGFAPDGVGRGHDR